MEFRYRWASARWQWLVLCAVTLAGMLLFAYLIMERQFGIFSDVGHHRLQSGMPLWPLLFATSATGVGAFGCASMYSRYTKAYRLGSEGITERSWFGSRLMLWDSIAQADRIVEAARGPNGERCDLRGIRLVGGGRQMIIYDDLVAFELLKSSLSAEIKARGVPVSEKDAGWSATQQWRGSLWQQIPGGEGWQKVFVQRQIDEL